MDVTTTWDGRLVVLSVFIAVIGSYIALDFAGHMKSAPRGLHRKLWFAAGAISMGLAIYTMHFIGMLAQKMPMPVTYDPGLTLLSFLAAVAGAGLAFVLINRDTMTRFYLFFGGFAMGLAIVAMHYIGMSAMQMPAIIHYRPSLFILSIVVAILASIGALRLAFLMHTWKKGLFSQKMLSAVILGGGIAGMHYIGMTATSYRMLATSSSSAGNIPTVGSLSLLDILFPIGIFFGIALLLLGAQASAEQQKALVRATESERRFLATFEQAAVGIAELDLEGRWIKLNRRYSEILGYSQKELLQKSFMEVCHPEEVSKQRELYRRLVSRELTEYQLEARYIRKDQTLVWVNLSVSCVENENGEPLYAIAVVEDISERKATETALQKSWEREQVAADIIDSIRAETDLDTILRKTVDHIGKFTGADRCRIWLLDDENQKFTPAPYEYQSTPSVQPSLDMPLPNVAILHSMLGHPEILALPDVLQAECLSEQDKRLIKERNVKSLLHVPIVYRHTLLGALRVHSTTHHLEWDSDTVAQIKNVAAQAAIAIHYAKTLHNLYESEARKTAILESSLDAIITMDHIGIIREWNASAERIFGYLREEAVGQPLAELIIPERYRDAYKAGLAHYLATGQGPYMDKLMELPALRADGSEFMTELTIRKITMDGYPMFTSTLRDITERKKAEEEINQLTKHLENRVSERTKELQEEIARRKQTEEALR